MDGEEERESQHQDLRGSVIMPTRLRPHLSIFYMRDGRPLYMLQEKDGDGGGYNGDWA
jgi:hypothetical protein